VVSIVVSKAVSIVVSILYGCVCLFLQQILHYMYCASCLNPEGLGTILQAVVVSIVVSIAVSIVVSIVYLCVCACLFVSAAKFALHVLCQLS
jgi:hypothetical protein